MAYGLKTIRLFLFLKAHYKFSKFAASQNFNKNL